MSGKDPKRGTISFSARHMRGEIADSENNKLLLPLVGEAEVRDSQDQTLCRIPMNASVPVSQGMAKSLQALEKDVTKRTAALERGDSITGRDVLNAVKALTTGFDLEVNPGDVPNMCNAPQARKPDGKKR